MPEITNTSPIQNHTGNFCFQKNPGNQRNPDRGYEIYQVGIGNAGVGHGCTPGSMIQGGNKSGSQRTQQPAFIKFNFAFGTHQMMGSKISCGSAHAVKRCNNTGCLRGSHKNGGQGETKNAKSQG